MMEGYSAIHLNGDIGRESAYMRKLPGLPPGTSEGLLHFVQRKRKYTSHKMLVSEKAISDTRYAIHMYLRRHIQKKFSSQKMSKGTVPTCRTKKGAVMQLLPSYLQKSSGTHQFFSYMIYHVNHVLVFYSCSAHNLKGSTIRSAFQTVFQTVVPPKLNTVLNTVLLHQRTVFNTVLL